MRTARIRAVCEREAAPDPARPGRLEFGVHRGFSVFRIRPDGSGMTGVTRGQPGVNEFPEP